MLKNCSILLIITIISHDARASYNQDHFDQLSKTGKICSGNLVGADLTKAYQAYRIIFEKQYAHMPEHERPAFEFTLENTDISQARLCNLFRAENISFIKCIAHKVQAQSFEIDNLVIQGGEWKECSITRGKIAAACFSTCMKKNIVQGTRVSSSKIQAGELHENSFAFCTFLGCKIISSKIVSNIFSSCTKDHLDIEGVNSIRKPSLYD